MERNMGWICLVVLVVTLFLFGLFIVNSRENETWRCMNMYNMNYAESKVLVEHFEIGHFPNNKKTRFGVEFN